LQDDQDPARALAGVNAGLHQVCPEFAQSLSILYVPNCITMIVADLSTIPMGTGTSASRYVSAVYDVLKEYNVKYVPGPMSTALEVDSFEQLFEILEKANKKLAGMGVLRIITTVRIDYRLDRDISIESKLRISKMS